MSFLKQLAGALLGFITVLAIIVAAIVFIPQPYVSPADLLAFLPHTHAFDEALPHTHNEGETAAHSHSAGSGELAILQSLWLGNLPPLPPDPSNAAADDPRAARLGQRIFFDPRFSGNGAVSCATCHRPGQMFTDNLPLAQGMGVTRRKTMTIVGTAYSPWLFWDGRADSQWAQALGPMESEVEHGGSRAQYARLIAADATYRAEYETVFGPLPDLSDPGRFPAAAGPVADSAARAAWEAMSPADRDAVSRIYANIGKAIAAYERLILPAPSRFDFYVQALLENDAPAAQYALTAEEEAGLHLFIGKAHCLDCHNGPLLTNNSFHNTGVPPAPGLPPDDGRLSGVQQVIAGEFNCLGPYSDAAPEQCDELRFVRTSGPDLAGSFKPPSLRNVAETGPYMHAGQFATLAEVLQHYNRAKPGPLGQTELLPLDLTTVELAQLEAFLRSLSSPLEVDPALLAPPVN